MRAVATIVLFSSMSTLLAVNAAPIDPANPNLGTDNYLLGTLAAGIFAAVIVVGLIYIIYRLIKKWSSG